MGNKALPKILRNPIYHYSTSSLCGPLNVSKLCPKNRMPDPSLELVYRVLKHCPKLIDTLSSTSVAAISCLCLPGTWFLINPYIIRTDSSYTSSLDTNTKHNTLQITQQGPTKLYEQQPLVSYTKLLHKVTTGRLHKTLIFIFILHKILK